MYSQQPSNVPTRLQSNSTNRRKPRLNRRNKLFCTKAVSVCMALLFVVLSLSTGVIGAFAIDNGMEVGFEPEYQDGTDAYASDNALFEQYENALSVTFKLYGVQELTVYSAPTTVGELLNMLSINLNENDRVSADVSAQITDAMVVSIDRVETKTRTEIITTPYATKTVENSTLEKGTTRVKQQGVKGELEKTITETYVNGELVSSEVTSEVTKTELVDEIIEVGTYVKPAPVVKEKTTTSSSNSSSGGQSSSSLATMHSVKTPKIQGTQIPNEDGKGGTYIDSKGNSYKYLYYIDVIATAYGYSAGSLTATGKAVGSGKMAVDPRLIPYHTRCYVTGNYGDMGVQVAEDCGNFRGNWIDLFLGDDATCRQFGKRSMRVYILA